MGMWGRRRKCFSAVCLTTSTLPCSQVAVGMPSVESMHAWPCRGVANVMANVALPRTAAHFPARVTGCGPRFRACQPGSSTALSRIRYDGGAPHDHAHRFGRYEALRGAAGHAVGQGTRSKAFGEKEEVPSKAEA